MKWEKTTELYTKIVEDLPEDAARHCGSGVFGGGREDKDVCTGELPQRRECAPDDSSSTDCATGPRDVRVVYFDFGFSGSTNGFFNI